MAVREGLGDLPIFDTDILPGRQNIMQEEVEEDDYQYITKMYPAIAREILEFIEDLCDRLEYEGSMMFDQYMDRTNVLTMADKVYDKVKYHENAECMNKDSMLYQTILVLLGGEICHRRLRKNRAVRIIFRTSCFLPFF